MQILKQNKGQQRNDNARRNGRKRPVSVERQHKGSKRFRLSSLKVRHQRVLLVNDMGSTACIAWTLYPPTAGPGSRIMLYCLMILFSRLQDGINFRLQI